MAGKIYIYSTITCDNRYAVYEPAVSADSSGKIKEALPRMIKREVLIRGGSGVANKKTLVTPFGVVTTVTENDLEMLLENNAFSRHVKRGFLKVSKKKLETEKVVKDMEKEDKSSPLTEEKLEKEAKELGKKANIPDAGA